MPNLTPTIAEKVATINRAYARADICGYQYDPGYALMMIDSRRFEMVAAECLAEEEAARIADGEAREEERKVNVDEGPGAEHGV
jgi:hypothetical protein